ncbi:2-dehydro-3-deoxygalactonokinase [Microbulbifer celer]|uniref:2-dehydro-3-deoxygalactonokinase n=1 Tax=Microbulbifer celer TaxID=435905 RepID=A0ABW3UAS6_9GAMM|nr:2-dehydro-3-deoxygalactonokinase [Microbulbifer celer]UFN57528.1 2-dehydro-3-deoxygalactonokinase [Microbulbifer celer]
MATASELGRGLLALDWGTSSFRLTVINDAGEERQQLHSDRGIAQISQQQLLPYLLEQIAALPEDLQALPVIICGMAGSTIGLQDVPYHTCPADPQQLANALAPLDGCELNASIVPGLSARNPDNNNRELEVMRGEETQIVGWLAQASEKERQSSWLCLPGTHAKWVEIKQGRVQGFRTAMTGELYALLRKHSVLVQGEQTFSDKAFASGLAAKGESLSFDLFSTRTRVLDQRLSPQHSAAYLSGLLIGSEIRALSGTLKSEAGNFTTVHLIGDQHITDLYCRGLAQQDIQSHQYDGAALAVKGLRQLYLQSNKHD